MYRYVRAEDRDGETVVNVNEALSWLLYISPLVAVCEKRW